MRRGWRQQDLAAHAGVSRALASMIERGRVRKTTLQTLRAVASAVDVTIDLLPRWRGGEVDRVMNAGHSALHEEIAAHLDSLTGWIHAPEVSFSIFGERGVIDILAFYRPSGSLLVIELKTELTDLENLLAVMSRRVRLARKIALDRGWDATTVSSWVVVAESDTNRRVFKRFEATIRSAFPANGHAIRNWFRQPAGRIDSISFWANATGRNGTERLPGRRRVRLPRPPIPIG